MLHRPTLVGSALLAATLLFIQHPSMSSSLSLDRHSHIATTWNAVEHDSSGIPRIDPPRSGHVAFSVDNSDGLASRPYVFGGYCEEEDGSGNGGVVRSATNELWTWLGDAGGWEKVEQNGEVPGPRLASAAVVLGGRPYLFGGWDPQTAGTGGVILDSVHRLDPSTHTWSKLSTSVPGGPTSRHVALTLLGCTDCIIHNHRCSDYVLVFCSETEEFREQKTTGEAPSPRGLHSAVMCGRYAVVFGGAGQTGAMSNEAFLLDTESWKWTKLRFEASAQPADAPSPRAASCLCSVSSDCVLLFGGAETTESGLKGRADLWALHFDADSGIGRWELLIAHDSEGKSDNVLPQPRNAATFSEIEVATDAGNGRNFLLQGGWAPFRTTWADSYVLNVQKE